MQTMVGRVSSFGHSPTKAIPYRLKITRENSYRGKNSITTLESLRLILILSSNVHPLGSISANISCDGTFCTTRLLTEKDKIQLPHFWNWPKVNRMIFLWWSVLVPWYILLSRSRDEFVHPLKWYKHGFKRYQNQLHCDHEPDNLIGFLIKSVNPLASDFFFGSSS